MNEKINLPLDYVVSIPNNKYNYEQYSNFVSNDKEGVLEISNYKNQDEQFNTIFIEQELSYISDANIILNVFNKTTNKNEQINAGKLAHKREAFRVDADKYRIDSFKIIYSKPLHIKNISMSKETNLPNYEKLDLLLKKEKTINKDKWTTDQKNEVKKLVDYIVEAKTKNIIIQQQINIIADNLENSLNNPVLKGDVDKLKTIKIKNKEFYTKKSYLPYEKSLFAINNALKNNENNLSEKDVKDLLDQLKTWENQLVYDETEFQSAFMEYQSYFDLYEKAMKEDFMDDGYNKMMSLISTFYDLLIPVITKDVKIETISPSIFKKMREEQHSVFTSLKFNKDYDEAKLTKIYNELNDAMNEWKLIDSDIADMYDANRLGIFKDELDKYAFFKGDKILLKSRCQFILREATELLNDFSFKLKKTYYFIFDKIKSNIVELKKHNNFENNKKLTNKIDELLNQVNNFIINFDNKTISDIRNHKIKFEKIFSKYKEINKSWPFDKKYYYILEDKILQTKNFVNNHKFDSDKNVKVMIENETKKAENVLNNIEYKEKIIDTINDLEFEVETIKKISQLNNMDNKQITKINETTPFNWHQFGLNILFVLSFIGIFIILIKIMKKF
ncbi:hypothetical protein [Mycoplasma elephantis]|uniref:hypothetical protein n=1 Tax=Mycoplasma elephantis TaxID=114882 RepID=UPI000484D452|nr:hypothetical protein [Mycoplasma elephantis]